MATPKKGQTQLLKSDREKILTSVFMALAKQVGELTQPAINQAFETAFLAIYLKRFNTKEKRDAAELLIAEGLVKTIKSFCVREFGGDYDQIGIDSGVSEFNQITGLPSSSRHSKGFSWWCGSQSVRLATQYPDILEASMKYEKDYDSIRTQLRGNLVDALTPYREYALTAAVVRGVVLNAKSVEDLLEKAPEIKEVVLAIVNIPKPVPAVIDDKVSSVLSSLKPIEV